MNMMTLGLALILTIVAGVSSAPNDLKVPIVENQVAGGSLGASASFGGFSASAGLGGSASTAGDATGGGSVATKAGATVVSHPGPSGQTFFDRIFNIPISVLHSVNTHLNNRGAVRKGVVVTNGGSNAHADASATASASAGASSDSATAQNPDFRSSAGIATVAVAQKPPGFYDSIFNIPISALRSVNQLLNG